MMRAIIASWMAICAALGLWGAWMWLDDQPAYEYLRGEIVPDPAVMGSQVLLPWTIKVHRLCPGNVLRVLYDADTGEMVAAYDRTPSSISVKMGDTQLVKSFQLPVKFVEGSKKYVERIRYTANVCFECNPLQKLWPVCVQTPDLFFSISN